MIFHLFCPSFYTGISHFEVLPGTDYLSYKSGFDVTWLFFNPAQRKPRNTFSLLNFLGYTIQQNQYTYYPKEDLVKYN